MWNKLFIDKVEEEFNINKLRNKHVFHDINLRISDPDEFKSTTIQYLRGLGYSIDVNELTEFSEDKEFNKFFKGGRLKPIKSIIKATSDKITGSRFPAIWKLLMLTGIVSLIGLLLPYQQLNKELLLYITTLSLTTSLIAYGAKQHIKSVIWVKLVGVYDVEGVKADVRVIISADVNKYNKKVFNELRDNTAELYDLISHKYLKPISEPLMKPVTKSKKEELFSKLTSINEQARKLREQLINNKISEQTYNKVHEEIINDKKRIETLIDLLSLE